MTNEKVYIHEFVEIIAQNRANYMHHITANWGPIGQEERDQLCFGVWGTVGSTGRWPEVINIWEEDGWPGIASSFSHELDHPDLQDPSLAEWWAEAANYRSGGFDRVLVPAPWMRTIGELCEQGVTGSVYAHEIIKVTPGRADDFLDAVEAEGIAHHAEFGWDLAGAWKTAMIDESECILLWAIPTWEAWTDLEAAQSERRSGRQWLRRVSGLMQGTHRFLMVDAPLSPFRTGRQPLPSDRKPK